MQVWMWRIISCVMLCIVSWKSQGLVMAKYPCEATITKRLAWLVERLVVSNHEFFFYFFVFKTNFKTTLSFFIVVFHSLVHHCSHLSTTSSSLFHFPNHFTTLSLCVLLHFSFHFHFLVLLYRFHSHFFIVINSPISSPSSHITFSFLFLFSLSSAKKNLLINDVNTSC